MVRNILISLLLCCLVGCSRHYKYNCVDRALIAHSKYPGGVFICSVYHGEKHVDYFKNGQFWNYKDNKLVEQRIDFSKYTPCRVYIYEEFITIISSCLDYKAWITKPLTIGTVND